MKKQFLILSIILIINSISYGQKVIYGTTLDGGTSNFGTIFKYDFTNTSILHSFSDTGPNLPAGDLIEASNGKLYGATKQGGLNNLGTFFEFNPKTNTYVDLYNFNTSSGYNINGQLMQASNGKIYGLFLNGGAYSNGALFEYDIINNSFTTLISFDDDAYPDGNLIEVSPLVLVGTTTGSGSVDAGTIFEFDIITQSKNVLYSFPPSGSSGSRPKGIMQASDGNLYGVTDIGGTDNNGVLYKFDYNTNSFSILYEFSTSISGGNPNCILTEPSPGILLGSTTAGGTGGNGLIFEYTYTNPSYDKKINLNTNLGGYPIGEIISSGNNKFIFTNISGGASGSNTDGTLLEYDFSNGTASVLYDFNTLNAKLNPNLEIVFSISPTKLNPNLICPNITKKMYDASFDLREYVYSSSPAPLSFSVYSGSSVEVTNSGLIKVLVPGISQVIIIQAENENYEEGLDTIFITVNKAVPSIDFQNQGFVLTETGKSIFINKLNDYDGLVEFVQIDGFDKGTIDINGNVTPLAIGTIKVQAKLGSTYLFEQGITTSIISIVDKIYPPIAVDDYKKFSTSDKLIFNIAKNDSSIVGALDYKKIDLNPETDYIDNVYNNNGVGIFTVDTLGNITYLPLVTAYGDNICKYIIYNTRGDVSNVATVNFNFNADDDKKLVATELITPNADGVNDYFVIEYINGDLSNIFYVYDNRGNLVYSKENYSNSWNGTSLDNKELSDGTYYYSLKENGGNNRELKGVITIKR